MLKECKKQEVIHGEKGRGPTSSPPICLCPTLCPYQPGSQLVSICLLSTP